jgi:hypothetical protein
LPKDAKKTNRKAFDRTKNFIDKVFNENSQMKVNLIVSLDSGDNKRKKFNFIFSKD